MPNIPERWDGVYQWYFVTVVTRRRRKIFFDPANCQILLDGFREVRGFHPFLLAGLVIMPDHWHGLIHPKEGGTIETVVGGVKKNFLGRFLSGPKQGSIWQPRFLDRRIRNREEFNHYLEYIRINPEKHQQVERANQWPWCYFDSDPFGQKRPGRNPALPFGGDGEPKG